jgi:phosphate ABC transporter phosphate-binding protein
MAASLSASELRARVERSRLLPPDAVEAAFSTAGEAPPADRLVHEGYLTPFQVKQLEAGRTEGFFLTDKYKLLDFIGHGGMGKVFLCEHLLLHRLVAIKLLQLTPAEAGSDAAARTLERFYREARAVAALDHPNIVHLYDVDRAGPNPFMVMEYVDGNNLHAIVGDHGPLAPVRAAHYVAQAARGLHYAHQAGLIHRDVKPANLMLDRTGVVKILDLGLARFYQDPARNQNITARYDKKVVIGTIDFMAPEQAEDSSAVDARSDVYSLGCTLYFLLTRRVPFPDRTVPQKMYAHQTKAPAPVSEIAPGVPPELLEVLDRMMAKDPAERYQTPAEVEQALTPWTETPVDPPAAREMPEHPASFYRLGLSPISSALTVTPNPSALDTSFDSGGAWDLPSADAPTRESKREPPRPASSDGPSFVVRGAPPRRAPTGHRHPLWMYAVAFAAPIVASVVVWLVVRGDRPKAEIGDLSRGGDQLAPPPEPKPAPKAAFTGQIVNAGGTTFVESLMERWGAAYEKQHGVRIDFRAVSSAKGIDGTLRRVYAFGCTNFPMTEQQILAAQAGGDELVHVPLVLGAVAVTYNVPGVNKPLRFTGPVLAGIYLGRITVWDDDTIKASNPGVELPALPIRLVGRADVSGTTYLWTEFLTDVSSEFQESHGVHAELTLPFGELVEGNNGVADRVSRTAGGIGYVELHYAKENGLPVAELKNPAGKYVAPTLNAMTAAAAGGLKTVPADLRFTLINAPGPGSYPLTGATWAILFADQTKRPAGKAMVEFLRWATHEGQAYVKDTAFAPLPPDLVARIDERLAAIKVSDK